MALFKLLDIIFIVVLLSATSSAYDDFVVELKKHVELLEAKLEHLEKKHESEMKSLQKATDIRIAQHTSEMKAQQNANALQVAELTRKLSDVDQRMAELESENKDLVKKVRSFQGKTFRNFLVQKTKSSDTVDNDGTNSFEKKTGDRIKSNNSKAGDLGSTLARRALQSDMNVAFTAYLDHNVDHLGAGQTLKFNKLLLNDGNGYNVHSGAFTAPVAGVYSFTFFIAERDIHETRTGLFVNDKNALDAVAQTNGATQDVQGGNSAVLKVAAGDIVFVKLLDGSHVEGQVSLRFTSFSGFLLYPTESGPSVVG